MQLVAYGAQDIYLTGNPMITYFKMVWLLVIEGTCALSQVTFKG